MASARFRAAGLRQMVADPHIGTLPSEHVGGVWGLSLHR